MDIIHHFCLFSLFRFGAIWLSRPSETIRLDTPSLNFYVLDCLCFVMTLWNIYWPKIYNRMVPLYLIFLVNMLLCNIKVYYTVIDDNKRIVHVVLYQLCWLWINTWLFFSLFIVPCTGEIGIVDNLIYCHYQRHYKDGF